jgi:GNAT superfamily N-acetyltransferase
VIRISEIRDYQPGDETAVRRMVAEVLALHGLEFDPDGIDGDLTDIQAAYIESGGMFRVVMATQGIVGSCGLYPEGAGTYELRKMYLLPAYQGQGVGRRLLADALAWARERDARSIVLESNSKLTRAARLYEAHGFVRCPAGSLSGRCDFAMHLKL